MSPKRGHRFSDKTCANKNAPISEREATDAGARLFEPFDVVVLGGGNAALCAAITAARAGCRVIVIEGAPEFYRGGNTRHTRNLRCAHDGTRADHDRALRESTNSSTTFTASPAAQTDKVLAELTVARSTELLPLDGRAGRALPAAARRHAQSLGKTNAFFLGGGRGALNALYRKRAERSASPCVYDSPVDRARHRATATSCRRRSSSDGKAQPIRGRALVAAAGGFEANIEWLKKYWGEAADNFLIRGTPYNRGEVLRMLLDAGVVPVGDPTQCHAVAIDARAPKFDGGIATRLDCDHLRHRRQPRRAALLRRGRGHLAQALRHLGPPGGAAAGADRLFDHRRQIDAICSCRRSFPPSKAGSIARTCGQARARPGGAGKNRRRLQRRGAPRHFRSHRARRLRDTKG